MNTVLKSILTIILFVLLASITSPVYAQYGCPPYGAECPASSQLVIDKFIRDPSQKGDGYVDNLLLSHYRFTPNEDIFFKIVVRNSGNRVLRNVAIQDYIPVYTNYVNESAQILPTTRDVSTTVGTLNPGESKDWYIRVRVKPANELSGGLVCGDPNAINKAVLRAENQPESWDTSSFCVQKQVLGASTQPAAG